MACRRASLLSKKTFKGRPFQYVLVTSVVFACLFLFRLSNHHDDRGRTLTVFDDFRKQFKPVYPKEYRIDYRYSHPLQPDVTCRLPYYVPDNFDIKYYLESRKHFTCPSSRYEEIVTLMPDGRVKLNTGYDQKCSYSRLAGTLHPNSNEVEFRDGWTELTNEMQVNADQFVVRCVDLKTNETVFLDAFVNIVDRGSKRRVGEDRLNVVLLVLDSVSKAQFQRHMPRTMQFLDRQDAAFMHGYTAISYDDDVNMMAMLGAKVPEARKNGFDFEYAKYWMNVEPEDLQRDLLGTLDPLTAQAERIVSFVGFTRCLGNGYVTMYNEDLIRTNGGLFHNVLSGFATPPSSFYLRPFYQFLYSTFSDGRSKICLNGKLTGHRTLDLMQRGYSPVRAYPWDSILYRALQSLKAPCRFSSKHRDTPHFSFNFVGTAHHNPNDLYLLDERLAHILKAWNGTDFLERTAFIVSSNHGQMNHPIHNTFYGLVEERNPVLAIHLPSKYKRGRPEGARFLKVNENRLSTHIDLYETVRDLLGIPLVMLTGRSFFVEKTPVLTCRRAQIPDHMCPCLMKLEEEVVNKDNMDRFLAPIQNRIHKILSNTPCLKEYVMMEPTLLYTHSIMPEVRFGYRDSSDYRQRNSSHHLEDVNQTMPFVTEYFDVSAVMLNSAIWIDGTSTNFVLNSRMTYNMVTNEIQHVVKPLLLMKNCDETVPDNICNCHY